MSDDFSTTSPATNDQNYFEYDPGQEAAEKAASRDFSIEEGFYPLVVSKFEKTTSKAGNPMLVIEFTGNPGGMKTKFPFKLYQSLSDNQYSKKSTASLLKNLGCEQTTTGGYKVDPSKFLGTTVDVFLAKDTYEGTTNSKPKYIRAIDTSGKGQF